jgi:ferredoxin
MELSVDPTRCAGIGLCEMTAPSVYEVGDDGLSHVINPSPPPDMMPAVAEAVASCPTAALSSDD